MHGSLTLAFALMDAGTLGVALLRSWANWSPSLLAIAAAAELLAYRARARMRRPSGGRQNPQVRQEVRLNNEPSSDPAGRPNPSPSIAGASAGS
jgi:hypothetical protein